MDMFQRHGLEDTAGQINITINKGAVMTNKHRIAGTLSVVARFNLSQSCAA